MGDAYDDYERRAERRWNRMIDRVEAREEARERMARKAKGTIDTSVVGTKVGSVITPEQLAASGTEHSHQVAFFQWVAVEGRKAFGDDSDLLFAVPNGGDRKAHVGAAMKAEGVKRGVPDVCWPLPRAGVGCGSGLFMGAREGDEHFAGLWIELKKPTEPKQASGGGRSDEQVKWHKRLRAQGYAVAVAYGWQAMVWVAWLYWRGELKMQEGEDAFMATAVRHVPVVRGG